MDKRGAKISETCGICTVHMAKYKCPKCRTKYCSVPCYRKHKEVGCNLPKKIGTHSSTACTHTSQLDSSGDEDKSEDQVSEQKLKLLGQSEELRSLLENPHLCNMLLALDRSDNTAKDIDNAMHEPVFAEFVDFCLQIVEPIEDEGTET
ncbi:zinc finger HIT domain-containing protein 3 isoform X2 [Lingula anatina]|uniref:Zinc finger HIT domain-containing protein 3 n=1 Tax=Lingula anatina TaxID=7574 RepID=A0A1S3KAI6_LINAN|nr:zinc finger HIT domain-containing protein 3 isoform X2 [Lingula anatina]|eukprot:XP_013419276.1 zinc finger HIT domain-containing protein 3 isoform X2 [Lingula anatina]